MREAASGYLSPLSKPWRFLGSLGGQHFCCGHPVLLAPSRAHLASDSYVQHGDGQASLNVLQPMEKLLALDLLNEAKLPAALDQPHLAERSEFGQGLVNLHDLTRAEDFKGAIQRQKILSPRVCARSLC